MGARKSILSLSLELKRGIPLTLSDLQRYHVVTFLNKPHEIPRGIYEGLHFLDLGMWEEDVSSHI